MTDQEHANEIRSCVAALNAALTSAKRDGLRAEIASVVEKDYAHTDRVELRDITKSLLPLSPPPRPLHASSPFTDY